MTKRWIGLLAAIAVSGVLIACGGDDEDPAAEGGDFTAAADGICTELQQQNVDLQLELGYDMSAEDAAERISQQIPLREQAHEELAALEVPEEHRAAYAEWLAMREESVELAEKQIEVLESGDEEASAKASAAAEKLGEEAQAAASELGMAACGLELPADDAEAAEAVLREFATTADPETSCGTLVTEVMIEDGFGGQKACEAEQRRIADDLAEDIEISDTRGVDDVVAFIDFEDVGGQYDGQAATATAYYLDGSWKLNQVSLAG